MCLSRMNKVLCLTNLVRLSVVWSNGTSQKRLVILYSTLLCIQLCSCRKKKGEINTLETWYRTLFFLSGAIWHLLYECKSCSTTIIVYLLLFFKNSSVINTTISILNNIALRNTFNHPEQPFLLHLQSLFMRRKSILHLLKLVLQPFQIILFELHDGS